MRSSCYYSIYTFQVVGPSVARFKLQIINAAKKVTDAVIETLQFNSSNIDPRELGQISDFQLEKELDPTGYLS